MVRYISYFIFGDIYDNSATSNCSGGFSVCGDSCGEYSMDYLETEGGGTYVDGVRFSGGEDGYVGGVVFSRFSSIYLVAAYSSRGG